MANSDTQQPEFSKFRKTFFPVRTFELKKVLPMGFIFFFIIFNYYCVRNVKDTLVVNAAGAEILSFLKSFCVTPAAILFMVGYIKLSNMVSRQNLFYITITPFIIFFGLFGYVLYPLQEFIHPAPETIAHLQASFPKFHWFFAIYGNWSYSLFYVLAEIWGSAILSLLFWQFANQITRIPEAKRFYALFGLMGQFSLIFSGGLGKYFSEDIISQAAEKGITDPWGYSLYWLMGMFVIAGIITVALYRWMNTNVLTDKRFYDPEEQAQAAGKKKKKPKLSLGDSFKVIFSSPYLGLIAILVISYGTTINLLEGLWKSRLQINFAGDRNAYNAYMNEVTVYTGFVSIAMMVLGGVILRAFSWTKSAIITPTLIFLGGALFFTFVLMQDNASVMSMLDYLGSNPLSMAIIMGASVVIITKSVKYALFDLTKEMAYIPLDDEMKVKGKAAVDVLGGRLGKSTGAIIQVILITAFTIPNAAPGEVFLRIAPIVASIFVVFSILWLVSVKALGKRVEALAGDDAK